MVWCNPRSSNGISTDLLGDLALRPWSETMVQKTREGCGVVIFFFPYNPPTPLPRPTPRLSHPEKLDFSPFRLRFGSVWLRFKSVSGPLRVRFGVLGGVGERGFCKGKEYHYCGCPKCLAGKVFRQISTLLENSTPNFWQHQMLGLGIFLLGKWLLENRPRLQECYWISSSETLTAFLILFGLGVLEGATKMGKG